MGFCQSLLAPIDRIVARFGRIDRLLDRQGLGDGQRQRVLAVDILAGLERLDGSLSVLLVGRGDEHAIEGLVVDEFAEVPCLGLELLQPAMAHHLRGVLAMGAVHVAAEVNVNCPAFTLDPDSTTTCRLRPCGLSIPMRPMTRRSLAEVFSAAPSCWAARSCRAYQVGSPAAAGSPANAGGSPAEIDSRSPRLPLCERPLTEVSRPDESSQWFSQRKSFWAKS